MSDQFDLVAGLFHTLPEESGSGVGSDRVGRTEGRLAEAGYPYGLRTIDFMGLKVVASIAISGLTFLLFGVAMGNPITSSLIFALIALVAGFVFTLDEL